MRRDPLHCILDPKQLKTCAIKRTEAGSASIDEGLIDIEKEQFHSLTTHQFFLGFKNLMSLNRIHFEFESAFGLQADQAIGKNGVSHFVFASAIRANHGSHLRQNVKHFTCQLTALF